MDPTLLLGFLLKHVSFSQQLFICVIKNLSYIENLGKYQEAIQLFSRVAHLADNFNLPYVYFHMGHCQQQIGLLEEAVNSLRQAAGLSNSSIPHVHAHIGSVLGMTTLLSKIME